MSQNREPLAKGPWKQEEDELLVGLVADYGAKDWTLLAQKMESYGHYRLGKQCRERWFNHLSPEVRKGAWTEKEDSVIIKAHNEWGNKWTRISALLDGRPPNAVKNHWNSTLKRKLRDLRGFDKEDSSNDESSDEVRPKKQRIMKIEKFESSFTVDVADEEYVLESPRGFSRDNTAVFPRTRSMLRNLKAHLEEANYSTDSNEYAGSPRQSQSQDVVMSDTSYHRTPEPQFNVYHMPVTPPQQSRQAPRQPQFVMENSTPYLTHVQMPTSPYQASASASPSASTSPSSSQSFMGAHHNPGSHTGTYNHGPYLPPSDEHTAPIYQNGFSVHPNYTYQRPDFQYQSFNEVPNRANLENNNSMSPVPHPSANHNNNANIAYQVKAEQMEHQEIYPANVDNTAREIKNEQSVFYSQRVAPESLSEEFGFSTDSFLDGENWQKNNWNPTDETPDVFSPPSTKSDLFDTGFTLFDSALSFF